VVGVATAAGGAAYDLSSWVVNDPAPDDAGFAVSGDPVTVTPGEPATLPLQWSGIDAKGLYLGLVTYSASDAPTLGNAGAASIVELTKTVDTPVATPTPTPTPTATPTESPTATPTATPAVTAPASPTATPAPVVLPGPSATPEPIRVAKPPGLCVRAVWVSGRTLRLWLANARGARVHVAITRGNRFVAASAARRVPARGALTLRLNHALRSGRYTVKVIAERGAQRAVVCVALCRRARA
jgi:hypothetical protein